MILFSTLDHRKLLTLPDIHEILQTYYAMGAQGIMSPEKRLYVYPDSGLIITIPPKNNQLVLHHFNFMKLMDATGEDYLFSESLPPHRTSKGEDLSYQIKIRSRRGQVAFHLENGPDGMALSPTGLVTWHCPETFPENSASAIISVNDASGQEIYHNISLTIQ